MLILFVALVTSNSFAQTIDKLPCYSQFKPLLDEWKVTNEWSKEFGQGLASSMLATPTTTFGEWVLAQKIDQGTALARADERGRLEVVFKGAKCEKTVKPYVNDKIPAQYFTDTDLKSFIGKQKSGVIYVWSPRMGLSEKGLKAIQTAAKELKLPLLMLMDKDVSEKERAALAKKIGKIETRQVDSFDFKMRNVSMHFPAVLVFKEGKILSGVKYGYENVEGYRRDLRSKLR